VLSVIVHATHPAIDARKGKRMNQFYAKGTASGNSTRCLDAESVLERRGPWPTAVGRCRLGGAWWLFGRDAGIAEDPFDGRLFPGKTARFPRAMELWCEFELLRAPE